MIVLGELQHVLLQLHLNMVAKRSRTVVIWRIDYGWYAQPQGPPRLSFTFARVLLPFRRRAVSRTAVSADEFGSVPPPPPCVRL